MNLELTHYPADILKQSAAPVEQIDDSIVELVDKMTDIMFANHGCGLAAPQAGVNLRLFIISMSAVRCASLPLDANDLDSDSIKVFINPTVTGIGKLEANDEGCLSVPNVYTKIRRYSKCTVTATGLDDKEFTEEADGLYARALQHEYDHINGMIIIDRMTATAKIMHRKKLKKLTEEHNKTADNKQ